MVNTIQSSALPAQDLRKRGARPSVTADCRALQSYSLYYRLTTRRLPVFTVFRCLASSIVASPRPAPRRPPLRYAISSQRPSPFILSRQSSFRRHNVINVVDCGLSPLGAAIVSSMVEHNNINLEEDVGSSDLCCFVYLCMYFALGSPGVSRQRCTGPALERHLLHCSFCVRSQTAVEIKPLLPTRIESPLNHTLNVPNGTAGINARERWE